MARSIFLGLLPISLGRGPGGGTGSGSRAEPLTAGLPGCVGS